MEEESRQKIKYEEWMGESESEGGEDQEEIEKKFNRKEYEGKKGHLLLQLQKSY